MTLDALQHVLRAASALAENRKLLVLGSASLLASHPELGSDPSRLLALLMRTFALNRSMK